MPQPPADAAPPLHVLGPRAVLADLPDLAAVLGLRQRVLADPPEHLLPGRAGTVPLRGSRRRGVTRHDHESGSRPSCGASTCKPSVSPSSSIRTPSTTRPTTGAMP